MTKSTILVAEDEAIIAADLESKLGLLGYQVVGLADTGEEAVQLACDLLPAVVLMDIRLKGAMDGIEAAEAIRRRVDLPVIYLTAHSDAATLSRAKVSEPFGYVLKPFEERELVTAIELALYKHQADRQVREQREWLRITLASIGDAVITCDSEGRTSYLNAVAEALTGWSCAEAAGRPIQEIFPLVNELTREPAEDPVAYVLRERRTKILANHTALRTRDGREIPIEDSAAPIVDAGGRVTGAVLVFHDVTGRRRAQEALQTANEELAAANEELWAQSEELRAQSEELMRARDAADSATRAKSHFLANMSHELRTPMTGVIGMLDLVLMAELEPEQRDCIVSARAAAHSMVRVVDDILDMAKLEAGKLSLEEKPFSLRSCVRDVFDILAPAARNKQLEFTVRVAEEVPDLLVGDRVRLKQVLLNVAGNAVKFTERGSVEIAVASQTLSGEGRCLAFRVTDTGIGIPEGKKGLLFREFSQVDESHSRSYGGTGLGLAIARELVTRMGGSIGFDSEEGKGSSFFFSVPLKVAAGEETVVEATEARVPVLPDCSRMKRKGRLLLAEDDPIVAKTLLKMLAMCGYEVDSAENGRKAVEMWEGGRYDMVIMDVQMPLLNGLEASAMIRQRERLRGGHIPIIAMTAHALKEDKDRCLAAGMDDYLAKPVNFAATLKLIAQHLPVERQ